MDRGPLETEIAKLWQSRLEGTPGLLQATLEERQYQTQEEAVNLLIRMTGATRDVVLLLAREIDKLNATRG